MASAILGSVAGGAGAVTVSLGTPFPVFGDVYNQFLNPQSQSFLLIGNGPVNQVGNQPGVGQAINVNNFELGAIKAPVPSPSSFGPNTNGPGLLGNVLDIPTTAARVGTGVDFSGNIAITNSNGVFNLQDVGVFADPTIGIRCAQSVSACDDGTQNSFFNDPNQFPNTFVANSGSPSGTNNTTGSGVGVNPNQAAQNTRIDEPLSTGVTGNVNFTALSNEIFTGPNSENSIIPGLAATGSLTVNDGTIQPSDSAIFAGSPGLGSFSRSNSTRSGGTESVSGGTFTLGLSSGLHVIDILTNGNDFQLDGVNFVIDGPSDAFAIFRLPNTRNFLISNSNVLAGDSIGLNNILFFSNRNDNSQHFNFNNTVINGVAFHTTAQAGGEIVINNAEGCTQLVADRINLNDVRFRRCAFRTEGEPVLEVPEPTTVLGLLGIMGIGGVFARRKHQS
ncbi:MAG: PEP-CTERM sorting domain-containing protein [Chloroflexaceae bacterium]|nr:PEP-CTERM sorting domain-containing protein [Chloroflexaceae bacterium]